MGLGATGLSIARYLKRNDANAIFFDSREEPPGLEELEEIRKVIARREKELRGGGK